MQNIQSFYPSVDGNEQQREAMLQAISTIITSIDNLKDPSKLHLGGMLPNQDNYYNNVVNQAQVPQASSTLEETINSLLPLLNGQRLINGSYVANATPLPTTSSIVGHLLMTLLNGNNVWDVECIASATAEVQITSMLSKVVGYDEQLSGGYTTWGGQGAVFNSLRLAIARTFPHSNTQGVPDNIYCFCSEIAHYSLYKSMQATGIGTDNLIKVKTNVHNEMDINDLREKMEQVISYGGIPTYVLATMGSTDAFSVDNIQEVKQVCTELEQEHNLSPIFIHADSAMGCIFAFLNDYDLTENKLNVPEHLLPIVKAYQEKFKYMYLADSMVFDFHKLGQTPYATSLFMVKDKSNFKYVDLEPDETPYIGNRAFGSYHTSYTLECSRAGTALPILAAINNLGVEGYQRILIHYLAVNYAFREQLQKAFPNVAITNDVSPMTTFRFYQEGVDGQKEWQKERIGQFSKAEMEKINSYNSDLYEYLSQFRDEIYYGSTRKQRPVQPLGELTKEPVFVLKFFPISMFTTVENIPSYVEFLKKHVKSFNLLEVK